MRYLQKLAIKGGGGFNNRYDLEQEIFIKDNHHLDKVKFRDKIIQVINKNKNKKIINAEVDNLNQLKQIVDLKIDRILFDNFSTVSLKKALKIIPKLFKQKLRVILIQKILFNTPELSETNIFRLFQGLSEKF